MGQENNIRKICMVILLLVGVFIMVTSEEAWAGEEINGNWHEQTATRERFCLNGEWDFHPIVGSD